MRSARSPEKNGRGICCVLFPREQTSTITGKYVGIGSDWRIGGSLNGAPRCFSSTHTSYTNDIRLSIEIGQTDRVASNKFIYEFLPSFWCLLMCRIDSDEDPPGNDAIHTLSGPTLY